MNKRMIVGLVVAATAFAAVWGTGLVTTDEVKAQDANNTVVSNDVPGFNTGRPPRPPG